MKLSKLVDTINRTYIQSDYIRQPEIYYYMDRVIDDINERLQTCYPTFSEWPEYCRWYNEQFQPRPEPPENPDGDCPPDQPHLPGEPGLPHDRPLPPHNPYPSPYIPFPHPGPYYPYPHPFRPYYPWPHPGPRPFRPKDDTVYDVIPDKYLRSVVALGAALYFYTADEEGEQIAMDYQRRYEEQLFYMVRDYHALVPPEFQNNTGGFIDFSYVREMGPWDLHPRGVVMRGYDSKVL